MGLQEIVWAGSTDVIAAYPHRFVKCQRKPPGLNQAGGDGGPGFPGSEFRGFGVYRQRDFLSSLAKSAASWGILFSTRRWGRIFGRGRDEFHLLNLDVQAIGEVHRIVRIRSAEVTRVAIRLPGRIEQRSINAPHPTPVAAAGAGGVAARVSDLDKVGYALGHADRSMICRGNSSAVCDGDTRTNT